MMLFIPIFVLESANTAGMIFFIIVEISEIEIPFGKRILIKKRKIKEQMKIILAQYFEIFQISSSGKIYNKNTMKLQEFEITFRGVSKYLRYFQKITFKLINLKLN